jgi:hypothetical protein
LFILDQAATGQRSTTVLSSYVETIAINLTALTAVPSFQSTNFVTLPFTANSDGSLPTPGGVNTGAGIVVAVNNSSAAYFVPVSNGATLGTPVALTPQTSTSQNVSGVSIDSNENVEVVSGTGASAVLNMYDSQGNWLLSAAGGVVSPNSSNGALLNAIPAARTFRAQSVFPRPWRRGSIFTTCKTETWYRSIYSRERMGLNPRSLPTMSRIPMAEYSGRA